LSETIVVGDFVDAAQSPPAITGAAVELRALDLVAHWKRCGLTADWLAPYFAYDFEPEARDAAQNVLATAVNELLENAAKFCADKRSTLRLSVRHHGDFIRIETMSVADDARTAAFRAVLEELGRADLAELFARRIEHPQEPGSSGVGLVILKKDYGGWDVHVQLSLDAEEVR